MPYTMPSRDAVGPNRTLTNISVAYMQEAGIFVARRLFPVVPVENNERSVHRVQPGRLEPSGNGAANPWDRVAGRGLQALPGRLI